MWIISFHVFSLAARALRLSSSGGYEETTIASSIDHRGSVSHASTVTSKKKIASAFTREPGARKVACDFFAMHGKARTSGSLRAK